ncbi:uncharacterized protein TRAVEDRAFT_71215 [Trametes versicolor FP-101664 SS1]|uniref:uncharacterized protein n=1 Tax=Trametes versicolor (strain FP-101664) TaxID=717944 RepID=UPI0004623B40|nr:uncharacterized protein TRAVEDRAFT_71215 [Trametes versicolor FP-101664 SS1]EIW61029.1 hypothetical protein TRAVEDRAFT_71215 [Trametes versicolor FP-101664 SS1]
MAVSSHRIHTIHGAFGAPSCFAPSMPLSINSAQASSFHRLPNVCAPRARPFRAVPGASSPASVSRTAPASSAPSMGSSAAGSRPRRTSLSFSAPPTPTRRAPPPPPAPAERTASALRTTTAPLVVEIPTIEDPFADAPEEPLDRSARTQVHTYTVPAPPAPKPRASMEATSGISAPPGLARTAAPSIPSARDIRGRLVASALLNRGSGRPLGVYLRRRLSGQEHVYIKSGLSQLVAVAA